MAKCWASTCFWARSIALVTILCSIGMSSSIPSRSISPEIRSDPKNPHQVILERQIESRRPWVTLTSGSAAELIVDTPSLVPLGTDDVETAGIDHFLVLGIGLLFEVGEDPLPVGARCSIEPIFLREVDERLVVNDAEVCLRDLFRDLFLEGLLAGHVFGVSPEQDIGAPTSHVGGNRDVFLCARPARRSRPPARDTSR